MKPVSGWKSSEHANTAAVNVSGVGIAIALINAGHVWPAVVVLFGPVLVTALYTVNRSSLKGRSMSEAIATVATASTSSTIVEMIDSAGDAAITKIAATATPKIKAALVKVGIADADADIKANNLGAAAASFAVEVVDVSIAYLIAKIANKKTAVVVAK